MPTEWFYGKGGQQFGPVDGAQLKQLAVSGQLQPTDLVWKQEMQDWAQASTIKALFSEVGPPPLPTLTGPLSSSSPAARPAYPWPEEERSSVSVTLRWTKIGMIASIVVGFLFL